MYDAVGVVLVTELIRDLRIEIEWGLKGAPRGRAVWTFQALGEESTFVNIVFDGFAGDEQTIFHSIIGSLGGFCWVLSGLKAWLERHIQLNVVRDRFPKGK
jgi:hypothetical protein